MVPLAPREHLYRAADVAVAAAVFCWRGATTMFVENNKSPSLVSSGKSICTVLPMLMLFFWS